VLKYFASAPSPRGQKLHRDERVEKVGDAARVEFQFRPNSAPVSWRLASFVKSPISTAVSRTFECQKPRRFAGWMRDQEVCSIHDDSVGSCSAQTTTKLKAT
jgi:hypothetical protein